MTDTNGNLEFDSEIETAFLLLEQGYQSECERIMLRLVAETRFGPERHLALLYYADALMKMERWDDAREVLLQSAQVAWNEKETIWLVRSHEKLGDLSFAEENWFGARHHYHYALRIADSSLEPSAMEQMQAKAASVENVVKSIVLSPDSSFIPLHQQYLAGNMAISFVHRDIFLKTYFARCLECNFCHDWCCSFGADIDLRNVEKIEQHREAILPFVRLPEGEWFEAESWYYEEYTGSQYTRINPQGPRCVFISKDQRGCGLHRYALSKGMDYHEIKPLVCILFPLSFGEEILTIAPELDDNSLVCAGAGLSIYQSLRSELDHYFGRELVEELDEVEKRVLEQS